MLKTACSQTGKMRIFLTLSRAVTASALAREESRGGHFRLDFPETNEAMAKPITIVRKKK